MDDLFGIQISIGFGGGASPFDGCPGMDHPDPGGQHSQQMREHREHLQFLREGGATKEEIEMRSRPGLIQTPGGGGLYPGFM